MLTGAGVGEEVDRRVLDVLSRVLDVYRRLLYSFG